MQIVEPYAELWIPKDNESHAIKCAQVCYASDKDIKDKHDWLESKWNSGHKSIFRHQTYYFVIPIMYCTECILSFVKNNSYVGYYINKEFLFISINGQTYREESWFKHLFKFSTSELGLRDFINNKKDEEGITKILRKTVFVQTQISTSRELNRTSPNNICEQSTRYCNFTKDKFDGEVKICKPWWFDDEKLINVYKVKYLKACETSTNIYKELIDCGFKPQDARGVLPIDTATKVVYTYRVEEWGQILMLRYYGVAGKPHPNAEIIADKIRKELNADLPLHKDASWTDEYFPDKLIL